MAAFYGEGIDNAVVEIDAPDSILAAFDFVEAIKSSGIKEQNKPREFIKVLKK